MRKGKTKNDLIGKRFGNLTVVDTAPNYTNDKGRSYVMWKCLCDCGTEIIVRGSHLTGGHTKSCGCLKKANTRTGARYDLVGKKIDMLTVLEYIGGGFWKCKCECGNIVNLKTLTLTAPVTETHRVSCGKHTADDYTGKRIGMLTVIKRLGSYRNPSNTSTPTWECVCDCGNTTTRTSKYLRETVDMANCGCLSRSTLEERTFRALDAHDYKICEQISFNGLCGVNNGLLSYDFCLNENNEILCLIECQGKQHYEKVSLRDMALHFEDQQEHDRRKRKYAKEHGIPLIEIPYTCDTQQKINDFLDSALSSLGITPPTQTNSAFTKINPLVHKRIEDTVTSAELNEFQPDSNTSSEHTA